MTAHLVTSDEIADPEPTPGSDGGGGGLLETGTAAPTVVGDQVLAFLRAERHSRIRAVDMRRAERIIDELLIDAIRRRAPLAVRRALAAAANTCRFESADWRRRANSHLAAAVAEIDRERGAA